MSEKSELSGLKIRPLSTFAEIDQVVELQRQEWDDPTTVIYAHMLLSLVRNGGSLIGALDGDRVVGFVLGYLGIDTLDTDRPAMANLKLCSQRMTVLPEYRNSGLGYRLKLAQRDYALKQGVRLITWTFDPMNSRNAHLNIRKLGCVVQDYQINYYGTQPSPLVNNEQSDRLVADWRISQQRVEQRLTGTRPPLTFDQYISGNASIINPAQWRGDRLPTPGDLYPVRSMIGLIEIPARFNQIAEQDEALAREWRTHGRTVFTEALRAGYFVTDFVHVPADDTTGDPERSFYVISAANDGNGGGFSAN